MNRILLNGFNEVKTRLSQLSDKYNEFKFGLSLISQKRYNYYFRVFMLSSTAVTTGVYFSIHSLPPMTKKWKKTIHMYDSGEFRKMDEELAQFAGSVWNDCNQTINKSSDLVDFFFVIGSDVLSVGSLGLPGGAIIGLPHSLTYKTIEDVKTVDIRFLGEHNPYAKWRSDSGQLLLKSLVLSENAKKFAIARQIYAANNVNLLVDSLNVGLSTAIGLGLGHAFLNTRKNPFWRNFIPQLTIRLISICFGYYFWYQMNKIVVYFASLSADKKAIRLGDDYLNGAIEYYSKVKARNAAFNGLMDDSIGQIFRIYTEEGEIKGFTKYLLTYERKINYFKELKNKLKDNNNNDFNKENQINQ